MKSIFGWVNIIKSILNFNEAASITERSKQVVTKLESEVPTSKEIETENITELKTLAKIINFKIQEATQIT